MIHSLLFINKRDIYYSAKRKLVTIAGYRGHHILMNFTCHTAASIEPHRESIGGIGHAEAKFSPPKLIKKAILINVV